MHPREAIQKLTEKLRPPNEEAYAGVAIIMKPGDEDIELLLVKRAEVSGDPWSGDMAFPGGKKTPSDVDICDTVRREVVEETGITLANMRFLGAMEVEKSNVRPGKEVLPLVFEVEEKPPVTLNYELTKAFWAPLKELIKTQTRVNVKGWDSEVFKVEGEVVWGMTYRMLKRIIVLMEQD